MWDFTLTSVVPKDTHLLGVPVPHHHGTVLASGYHVTVLSDVTLRPTNTRDQVEVTINRLRRLSCGNSNVI